MTKIIRLTQTYLITAMPFVIACMVWGTVQSEQEILNDAALITRALWEILSWNLILWFAILIVFLVLLVVSSQAREKTLKRLANLTERDEREQHITGKASRAAYISTLSLLLFFLFFSIFSINITRKPPEEAVNGKRGTLEIGLHFKLLEEPRLQTNPATGEILFESKDLPLSKSAILLTLILWQLLVFNFTARQEHLREMS